MIEKLLKCLLIKNNIEYKFTHDLYYLIIKASQKYPELNQYDELMERLSPHAVLSRYEEGYEIEIEEIKEMIAEAEKLRVVILNLLKASN